MTEVQAALGLSQLKRLSSFTQRRRQIVEHYDSVFKKVKNFKPIQSKLEMRKQSGHHLYVLRCDFKAIGLS
jgi:dTDP-4-amino-4,6-dideoxygalactose transaminase